MATVINAGRFASGNATQLQSIPILQQTPTPGQVLKADAQSNWAPGTDSDSANAVTLQNRALANTAPSDGQVIEWDNAGNTWKPATPSAGSSDATSIQTEPVDPSTPTSGQVLKYVGTSGAGGKWEPGADTVGTDATSIQGFDVTSSPLADGQQFVYNTTAAQWQYQDGTGVVDDGSRAFLKNPGHNLGIGTGAAGGLPGKIVAHNTGAGVDTKVVVESESGHTALHLRSNDNSDAVAGDRYAQVQFWNENANKAQLHYDPEQREIVLNSDATANSARGLSIREDGRTTFHRNEKISNFTVKQLPDVAALKGLDFVTDLSTTANASKNHNRCGER